MKPFDDLIAKFPALNVITKLPKPALIGIASGVIAIAVVASIWFKDPSYKVLFSNVSDKDGGAIVAALNKMNVPNKVADNGTSILVPEDRVHKTRMALAEQGLPQGGSVGLELMDNAKFGASQFAEQINYQRAIEGELARSISSMFGVESARVHLAMPKQSLFVRDRKQPTASVLLNLKAGRSLGDSQVASIAWLVASSVPDLTVDNVSIVDQTGRLLSVKKGNSGATADESNLKYANEIEQKTVSRIVSMLTPLVGAGNVQADVNVEVDFTQRESTSESYRPNQKPELAAVRSEQLNYTAQNGGVQAAGVPGALSNEPPATPSAPITSAPNTPGGPGAAQQRAAGVNGRIGTQNTNETKNSTINYEVDRTIAYTREATGKIKRMSVAVAINYRADKDGNQEPLDEKEIEQIKSLVIQAAGYIESRGDTISVANTKFNTNELALPVWKDPVYVGIGMDAVKYLVILIGLMFVWFKIVKPIVARASDSRKVEIDAATAIAFASSGQNILPEMEAVDESGQRISDGYDENVEKVRQIALEDPRAVAMVMRGWLNGEDSGGVAIDKCGVLLMSLGEEAAAGVIKNMSTNEIQDVGAAMASMKPLTRARVNEVLHEFRESAEQYRAVNFGSEDFIREMLIKAYGADRAAGMIEDIMDTTNVDQGIDALNGLEPMNIAELIADEHPQVIATILVHLDRDRAAGVLNHLNERLRTDVVFRIATFGGVQPVALHELTNVLNGVLSGQTARRSKLGGVRTAAEILNAMSSVDEEVIVKSLRATDPELSSKIEDEMFVFENIADLDDAGIQLILREVGNEVWPLALKGAKPALAQKILGNMSTRAAELIREDMEAQGPVRLSVVEAEQRKVLAVVRALADSGQLTLNDSIEDQYV